MGLLSRCAGGQLALQPVDGIAGAVVVDQGRRIEGLLHPDGVELAQAGSADGAGLALEAHDLGRRVQASRRQLVRIEVDQRGAYQQRQRDDAGHVLGAHMHPSGGVHGKGAQPRQSDCCVPVPAEGPLEEIDKGQYGPHRFRPGRRHESAEGGEEDEEDAGAQQDVVRSQVPLNGRPRHWAEPIDCE